MINDSTTRSLIRLVGAMAIAVALAWAVQVLGLGGSGALGRMMWVLGAAAIAGAGSGLLFISSAVRSMPEGRDARLHLRA